jgi:large-conductance mechanosensitive channel
MSKSDTTSTKQSFSDKSDSELKREAQLRLGPLDPVAAAALVSGTVGNKATGFIAFVRERAIVGLAIGFVIGTQVQTVVKQFIASFVDPLFKLLIPGNQVLSDRVWTVHVDKGKSVDFGWGALVYSLLDFFFIILVIYVIMHIFQLDKLDKKPE